MAKANGKKTKASKTPQGITHITVGGYKSIAREQTIEIRPLTILAGANSSGKSSMMQPLLLLKQTLEAPYDPGALLINGPNVKFTSMDQMLARNANFGTAGAILIGLNAPDCGDLRLVFIRNTKREIDVHHMVFTGADFKYQIERSMTPEEIGALLFKDNEDRTRYELSISRDRCFLSAAAKSFGISHQLRAADKYSPLIQTTIHIPGLRGHPERVYAVSSFGALFPGTFESYTASVIANWTEKSDTRLSHLGDDLGFLGLTSKVQASLINDAQVEIKVARLPRSSRQATRDLVSIADVGFGVSQTLPVVVALLAAEPGQLVYLEQPEIHLHPRAQVAMAQLLANAANRGVRVVAETHSSLLLLGIQSLVAEGKIAPDKVILHWFERNDEGATDIRTAELDEAGRFGDWPEDFHDVSLETQKRYLDAAELRRAAHG